MPFVKLDCNILNSTTWADLAARNVFLTALLLAEPREFTEPVEQIRVGKIEPTGWVAPPGWYGFVPASGPGLVGRSLVPDEEGVDALIRLGEPDLESRSSDFEGRRMIRVDGGYLILNYMKYRDKDHTAAERSARYRARAKADPSRRDATASHRNVTYARSASASASQISDLKSGSDPDPERATSVPKRARVFSLPSAEPDQAYVDSAVMAGVSREQAASTWEYYWGAGLPDRGVEKLHPWLVKQAKERANQTARVKSGPRSSGHPHSPDDRLRKQADRIQMLREQEAEEERRAKGAQ
jgi:hypothetical protein